MGVVVDYSIIDGRSPYSFRISGSNYHQIGTLLPRPNCKPMFPQLYVYDPKDEIRNRRTAIHAHNGRFSIDEHIFRNLTHMLNCTNPYVQSFRYARKFLKNDSTIDLRIRLIEERSRDSQQYNLPTAPEVAALMVGGGSENVDCRDVFICNSEGFLQRISECHPAYMVLQYPLLFPFGEDGWRINIPIRSTLTSTRPSRKNVTMREFYSYRIQYRSTEGRTLIESGQLFQQFVVDAYAAIEEQRLYWVRKHQRQLQGEVYQGLQDAVESGDHDARKIGQRVILPSSFTGGARYMGHIFQDTMAICQWYGVPDLFITFTCNSKWIEITSAWELILGQKVEDRPDIVARVFNIKKKQLLNDLRAKKVIGSADVHVVEFQKRGLPHVHILLTLASEDRIVTANEIDNFICVELPDKDDEPLLFEIV
ncbi:uncharacterized protein LOC143885875 [Tasmannia lanceolata]|uniref:uncharacterized protein LOC143885875 n=1 Tax=Tasmannia lanceolata TaxID=3420 RepID=UPI004064AF40